MAPSTKDKSRLDLPEIQKLIRMIEKSPIMEFSLEDKDLKIRISKNGALHQAPPALMQQQMPTLMPLAAPAVSITTPAETEPAPPAIGKNIVEIKAPMVGTFYHAPSPDADPYVSVGDHIEPTRVLCIIEAMKLMNEIEAEASGRITEICVENAQPVEFGQVLFRIDKTA